MSDKQSKSVEDVLSEIIEQYNLECPPPPSAPKYLLITGGTPADTHMLIDGVRQGGVSAVNFSIDDKKSVLSYKQILTHKKPKPHNDNAYYGNINEVSFQDISIENPSLTVLDTRRINVDAIDQLQISTEECIWLTKLTERPEPKKPFTMKPPVEDIEGTEVFIEAAKTMDLDPLKTSALELLSKLLESVNNLRENST